MPVVNYYETFHYNSNVLQVMLIYHSSQGSIESCKQTPLRRIMHEIYNDIVGNHGGYSSSRGCHDSANTHHTDSFSITGRWNTHLTASIEGKESKYQNKSSEGSQLQIVK